MAEPIRLRPRAKAGRHERPRSRMFSIRLSEEEYELVQQVADAAHLPASTMIRAWVLSRLDQERSAP